MWAYCPPPLPSTHTHNPCQWIKEENYISEWKLCYDWPICQLTLYLPTHASNYHLVTPLMKTSISDYEYLLTFLKLA